MTDDEIRAAAEAAVNTRSAYVSLPATAVLELLDRAAIMDELRQTLDEASALVAEVRSHLL